MSTSLFERFLSTPEAVDGFEAASFVQAMLDFEAALATAQGAEGVIPAAAAGRIAAACRVERLDVPALVAASGRAGTLAIPLVKQLTAAVARDDAEAAGHVHWGSTSQDVIDTAMVLVTRRSLARIDAGLLRLVGALQSLERRHGDAPMLARTLMQPAQVVSFRFKLLAWAAPLGRARQRLATAAVAALQLQLGGAVGTLSVMGERGPAVARRVAAALGLRLPLAAWHTQRDDAVALACEVAVLTGSLGKIATDLALLSQGEIAEVAEPSGAGRGGSSAMPHKRNPVAAMVALTAAARVPHRIAALLAAMPQQHERGLGTWQAELAEWPGVFIAAEGAIEALAAALEGLEVDPVRMRRNIDAMGGLVFAEAVSMLLARKIGKSAAHAAVEGWSRRVTAEGRNLHELALEALAADPALAAAVDRAELDAAFDADRAARHASAVAQPGFDALALSVAGPPLAADLAGATP